MVELTPETLARYIRDLTESATDAIEAHGDLVASEPDERHDLADVECEVDAVMLRDTLAKTLSLQEDIATLRKAGLAILAHMHETYRARNGREVAIQGDDGEKCWIVHSDYIHDLRTAIEGTPS